MFRLQDHNLGAGTSVCNSNLTRRLRMNFIQFISTFHKEESGQDLVEYALVLIAVASGVFAGSATLSSDSGTWIANLKTKISGYLTYPGYGAGQHLAAGRRASILKCRLLAGSEARRCGDA